MDDSDAAGWYHEASGLEPIDQTARMETGSPEPRGAGESIEEGHVSHIACRRRKAPLAGALLLLSVGAATAAAGATRPSAACGQPPGLSPGESIVRSLEVGGLEREYRLHLPPGYVGSTPVPLVLVIHGYTGTAEQTENENTSFTRHADEQGYAVAYPQATGFEVEGSLVTSWNDLACGASPGPEGPTCTDGAFDYPTPPECGAPRDCDWCSCHDDVGFIMALLDEIEGVVCVDLDRVFATGISNGAMLVHRLGCDRSDRFAAIAPVAGTPAKGFNCSPDPSPGISMMNIFATRDRVVPFDGTPAEDGFVYTPTSRVVAKWADSQRCDSEEQPLPDHEGRRSGLSLCSAGGLLHRCRGGGLLLERRSRLAPKRRRRVRQHGDLGVLRAER